MRDTTEDLDRKVQEWTGWSLSDLIFGLVAVAVIAVVAVMVLTFVLEYGGGLIALLVGLLVGRWYARNIEKEKK